MSQLTAPQLLTASDQDLAAMRAAFLAAPDSEFSPEKLAETFGTDAAPQLAQTVSTARKIAGKLSETEWINFVRTRQMPDLVPLTPSQMEAMRGGGWKLWAAVTVVAIAGAPLGVACAGLYLTGVTLAYGASIVS